MKIYKLNKSILKEITSYIKEEDVELYDIYGNSFDDTFTCICRDGSATCRFNNAIEKKSIIIKYPKLADVLTNKSAIEYVLKYRGLSQNCKIHYGDIMLAYGHIGGRYKGCELY